MAAYRRVYDSRHLQADCRGPDQLRNPTLIDRVWATYTFYDVLDTARQHTGDETYYSRHLERS